MRKESIRLKAVQDTPVTAGNTNKHKTNAQCLSDQRLLHSQMINFFWLSEAAS